MHTSTRGQRRCDGVAAALHLARNLSLVCGLLDSGGEAGGGEGMSVKKASNISVAKEEEQIVLVSNEAVVQLCLNATVSVHV